MSDTIMECNHLKKKLGHTIVLKDINLTLRKGEIYGLIGENGAGKTTTLKIITGLLKEDSGKISLLGTTEKLSNSRKKIGALVEIPALFPDMSAYQNLKTLCIQNGYNPQNILPILKEVGLDVENRTKVRHYSLGMKQRLGIAMSIIGNPILVILDEPLNGLDPTGIFDIRNLIYKLNQKSGITFLISSHMLTELYQVSTKFGFIHNGITVSQLTKDELSKQLLTFTDLVTNDVIKLKKMINLKYPNVKIMDVINSNELRLCEPDKELLQKILCNFSEYITGTQYHTESLEDFYMRTMTSTKKEGTL